MNLEIRDALEADVDIIAGMIERDSIRGTRRTRDEYLASMREIAADPDNRLVVAIADGCLIAVLQLTFIPGFTEPWRAQIENVRVSADVRNLGVGTKLMEWVIAQARERGCTLIQLTTNAVRKDAQRFYRRLGFEPSHIGMKLYL